MKDGLTHRLVRYNVFITIAMCILTLTSLGLEGISFLKYGHDMFSMMAVLSWLTTTFGFGYDLQMWINSPKTWTGLHMLISFQPTFLLFIIMAFFSATSTFVIRDNFDKEEVRLQ
jgi:hypothetical protein